ncbi:MAG: hypothetical protein Wins2KO_16040 [Winogradskyella sp.]
MHPFFYVIKFGEVDNKVNRLSWVKLKVKKHINQEKIAFCRIFLLLIDIKLSIYLFFRILYKNENFIKF